MRKAAGEVAIPGKVVDEVVEDVVEGSFSMRPGFQEMTE
jgi:DNA invertase Pin-like site-specific DNA recombinase